MAAAVAATADSTNAAMDVDAQNIGDIDESSDDEDMTSKSSTRMDHDGKAKGNKSTTPKAAVKPASGNSNSNSGNSAVVYSPELLQMYYSRLFPYGLLHSWLSYGNNVQLFSRREFSFTIEPVPGSEVYIRYQSFSNQEELAKAIVKRRPTKIDIGAVFSHPPKDHNTLQKSNFQPVERDLVFDIDLTDYDDVRKCGCSGASICPLCWDMMKMAVKVMDAGLREDFGFQHVCWFYSGRRGVHAWVSDESARELTDPGRCAVANYFEVNLGSEKNKDVYLPHPLHPMLARAYAELEPMFVEKIIPASGHGLLASSGLWNELLDSLPDSAAQVRDNLRKEWDGSKDTSSPEEKWSDLKKHLKGFLKSTAKAGTGGKAAKSMSTKDRNRLENWPVEVVFRYTYPRLDVNVSKMRNHLLKSPFCVHPKTGRVCVPFSADKVDDFDPFQVPTLPQLMRELDEYKENSSSSSGDSGDDDKDGSKNADLLDWQKTSLKGYFEPFQNEFLPSLLKAVRRKERDAAEQQAALQGDF